VSRDGLVRRLIARLRGRHRFNCLDQNAPTWDERAAAAVELCRRHVRPDNADGGRVIIADLGCGNRRLEAILAAGVPFRHEYRGYDLHPQSRRTVGIDLQRELPPGPVDVACLLGVLEYMADVPAFLSRLFAFAPIAVVSYTIFDCPAPLSPAERRTRGWLSDYTRDQFEALLNATGYAVDDRATVSGDRTVIWLARRPTSAADRRAPRSA
jgi:hypothetical protein